MMPNKYEQKYRAYLAMQKESRDIAELIRKEEVLIPFEKPVHKGWIVSIELRDDIARRDDASFLNEVIKAAYSTRHIRNVKHVRMMRAGHKGFYYINRKGEKAWASFYPGFKRIDQKDIDLMSAAIRKYFVLDSYNRYWWDRKYFVPILPRYWLVLKVRPHYVTHYIAKGGPLYQREAYLDDKIRQFEKAGISNYRRDRWAFPSGSYRADTRNVIRKFIKKEIEDIPHEKIHSVWG